MKVAVFGLGRMGCRHLQIIRDLGWEIGGIIDPKEERLSSVGNEYLIPIRHRFLKSNQMYKKLIPDCVIVSTTSPGHAPLTCEAAKSGVKFILCEKPMATSLQECDQMIEVCESSGARLAINHQMRFMDQYLKVKNIIESEEVGGLSSVTVCAGNFGLAMNGTHYFELFRWLTNEIPFEISAWFSNGKFGNPRGPQFEDCAGSIRVTTKSGKRFYMEIGADQGHGIRVIYTGRVGIMVADELNGRLELSARSEEHRNLSTTQYGMPSINQKINVEPANAVSPSRAVLEALVQGKNFPTGEDGRWAISTLVGAYLSNENGHIPIRLKPSNLPRDRRFSYA